MWQRRPLRPLEIGEGALPGAVKSTHRSKSAHTIKYPHETHHMSDPLPLSAVVRQVGQGIHPCTCYFWVLSRSWVGTSFSLIALQAKDCSGWPALKAR